MVELPNRATWIATANNPQLSMEIARRCVRVRIDAKVDQPWMRTGFKHDPMKLWARAHRSELVHSLLVLVQAWLAAGRPPGHRGLGSFDLWARAVGGILEHAEIPGFLEDTDKLYEAADVESQEWREFVSAWWAKFTSRWLSTGELLSLVRDGELLPSVIRNKDPQGHKVRLGRALSRARDRHFAQYRIEVGRDGNVKAALYRLVDTSTSSDGPPLGEQLALTVADEPVP
jgi:hypothetical protein